MSNTDKAVAHRGASSAGWPARDSHYTRRGPKLAGGVCSNCRKRQCWACKSLRCRCGKCHGGGGSR